MDEDDSINIRRPLSADELTAKLATTLRDHFCLSLLPEFSVVVEGWTDVRYCTRAAQLAIAEHGEDLLAIQSIADSRQTGILICTPGMKGNPSRGGTPQMVRLAKELSSYVFTLEMFKGIAFIFDHDDEGMRAREAIAEFGFKKDYNSLSLDPKQHPGVVAKKQVVIEDLLSLDLQHRFFATGAAWCDVTYEAGSVVRYDWHHNSKSQLCEFACTEGAWHDFVEIGRLLFRIRRMFGLPSRTSTFST